jgi:transcriptional regulator with XRE-family HTH domain
MLNREIFSIRFKSLRNTHDLSTAHIANLLSLKSKGSIGDFESQRSIPSSDILTDITNLFGVSLDWLTGYSDRPYRNEILLYLEKNHIDRILATQTKPIPDFALAYIKVNPTYLNPDKREQYFSLPIRANIIFFLNKFKLTTERFITFNKPLQTAWSDFDEFKTHALPSLLDGYQFFKQAKNDNIKQLEELFILLEKLLITREISTPIFDISIKK